MEIILVRILRDLMEEDMKVRIKIYIQKLYKKIVVIEPKIIKTPTEVFKTILT